MTKDIWVTSGFGYKSKKPFVALTIGGETSTQMTPDDAREIASNLFACADASEGDGFIVEFLAEKVGLKQEQAAVLLNEFREWREKNRP